MTESEADSKSSDNGAHRAARAGEAVRDFPDEAPEAFGRAVERPSKVEAFGRGQTPKTQAKKGDGQNEEPGAEEAGTQKAEGDDAAQTPAKPPFYKRPVLMTVLILSVLLAVGVGLAFWLYERQFESTDDAFIEGHVVQISPKLAAIVKAVHVDDNQRVKTGDLLIELDPRDFEASVEQARAGVASANGRLSQARTQLEVSKARVGEAAAQVLVAQANAENANRDYQRFQSLDPRARSQQQLDNATSARHVAAAQVEQAKANAKAAEAGVADAEQAIKTANAQVAKAAADLSQAELNLSYATIRAPSDGLVTRKSVEPGQFVQVAQPLFAIVPLDVWVTANFKETQLDLMRVGQAVDIKVDAFSDRKLHGKVDSIQNGTGSRFTLLPPENATGNYVKVVQRVPVKIVLDAGQTDDREHLLAPGLSVEPRVRVR